MKQLRTGEFHGQTNQTIHLNGVTLTDTEYTQEKVDWHYHENAYFTFILQGNVIEGNKKEVYNCYAGSLLFHNWEEPHYNIKPDGFTRGFHIEIEHSWIAGLDFELNHLMGSIHISNPGIKLLLYQIFKEAKINDALTSLSVEGLLLQVLGQMSHDTISAIKKTPLWVSRVKEILHGKLSGKHSLTELSSMAGIHPVHLSRDFARHFHCGLGDYIRKLKVEKALSLLSNKKIDLTEIAFDCGFADQSHFIRCFKKINGITPSQYRKLLLC